MGRLWDLLTVAHHAIARAVAAGRGDSPELLFEFLLSRPGAPTRCQVKSVIGPGDHGEN